MITTTRAEVESQTRRYFQPRTPIRREDIINFATAPRVAIPDGERLRLQELAAHDADGRQRHQEYLAKYGPQESLYTKYGRLTTNEQRDAFVQALVDSTMAGYAILNEFERQRLERESGHTPAASSAVIARNIAAQKAAIDMYQSMGGSAPASGQGGGTTA